MSEEMCVSSKFRTADVIGWDVRNWSAALGFWEREGESDLSNCLALELGAKDGGLSLWMALKGARVVCSDVNGPAEGARSLHERYGVSRSIEYRRVDAADIPYEDHFDVVLFKSVLGGIGNSDDRSAQARAIREIWKCLKPGGELFFAENLAASPLHRFFRRRVVRW